ncbi:MAG: cupin domain-containing protein [Candidatus Poribacteria bacterium]|nr:cupin domain-containing protein [Candidatus Poribacteria bacterium]
MNANRATITDLESATGQDFDWGALRWLNSGEIDPDAETTFGVVYIEAGKSNPLHCHPNCEEVIYVLSGKCEHRLGDEWYPLTPGQMMRIPRGVKHCARNNGWEPVRMIISYSAPDREFELVAE